MPPRKHSDACWIFKLLTKKTTVLRESDSSNQSAWPLYEKMSLSTQDPPKLWFPVGSLLNHPRRTIGANQLETSKLTTGRGP